MKFLELQNMLKAKNILIQDIVNCALCLRISSEDWQVKEFASDIEKIQKILKENGIYLSVSEVVLFWEWYSNQLDAGWMVVGKPEDVLNDFAWFLCNKTDDIE